MAVCCSSGRYICALLTGSFSQSQAMPCRHSGTPFSPSPQTAEKQKQRKRNKLGAPAALDIPGHTAPANRAGRARCRMCFSLFLLCSFPFLLRSAWGLWGEGDRGPTMIGYAETG